MGVTPDDELKVIQLEYALSPSIWNCSLCVNARCAPMENQKIELNYHNIPCYFST